MASMTALPETTDDLSPEVLKSLQVLKELRIKRPELFKPTEKTIITPSKRNQ